VLDEPIITERELTEDDKFCIWASDGVWEFISDQEAVDVVTPGLDHHLRQAGQALVTESVKRWKEV